MKIRNGFFVSGILFLLFLLFTVVIMKVDVQPIGPQQSSIGLATVNQFIFEKLGVHLVWYHITDWLGIVAILVALGFGGLGFVQIIKRKSLFKVDLDIIEMGFFYIVVIAVYICFEIYIVNYRPIVMSVVLEASYPSSHTMIVLCIMTTAMGQFQKKIKNSTFRIILHTISIAVIAVTIIGRLLSGVHWFTDIAAGVLLGSSLIVCYFSCVKLTYRK